MSIRKTLCTMLLLLAVTGASAQVLGEILSLDSCRARAMRNNKELQMAQQKVDVAHWNRKSAFTKYLPHLDVSGTYMYTSREISLLNDDQKAALGNLGNTVGGMVNNYNGVLSQMGAAGVDFQKILGSFVSTLPVDQQMAIGQLMASPEFAARLSAMKQTINGLPALAQQAGDGILDAFRTDTRNMGMVSAMFTQPIFMGGKIVAYNKITKYAEQLAQSKYNLEEQNVIVAVDETYWHIVQLSSKKKLAESYLELIKKLDNDVEQLIKEGFATKADGLSVKVKLNEAEVTMIQIDNGLTLLKMLLAQQCGMEEHNFTLVDENRDTFQLTETTEANYQTALSNRPEMQQLELAANIYEQKVHIARAEHLPTVALTGGYLLTNPSVFNGFQNKFGGMFAVGVGVKIPVLTWGDRFYKVRAAKSEAKIQTLHMQEIGEKIELQVKQCQQKLQEARERLSVAQKAQDKADENMRYAEYGLKEGVIPLSNVLSAQTAWLSAHSTYVTAQIDMMLADLYLRKSMGLVY